MKNPVRIIEGRGQKGSDFAEIEEGMSKIQKKIADFFMDGPIGEKV